MSEVIEYTAKGAVTVWTGPGFCDGARAYNRTLESSSNPVQWINTISKTVILERKAA